MQVSYCMHFVVAFIHGYVVLYHGPHDPSANTCLLYYPNMCVLFISLPGAIFPSFIYFQMI